MVKDPVPVRERLTTTLREKKTRKALTPAVVSGSQHHKKGDVNHDLKSLDAGQYESIGAYLPESDCDGTQTASISDPHIFLRAFVVKKPEVPTKGIGEAEDVADSAKGSQSTNATQTFQYDMKKLQKTFADMDKRLRSNKYSRYSHEYKKCPSRTLEEVERRSLQILQEGEKSSKEAETGSKPGEDINSTAPNDDDGNSGEQHIHLHTDHFDDTRRIKALTKHSRQQMKFLKTAKTLFTFFLPLGFISALVAKYWGAVDVLIEVKAVFPVLWVLTYF